MLLPKERRERCDKRENERRLSRLHPHDVPIMPPTETRYAPKRNLFTHTHMDIHSMADASHHCLLEDTDAYIEMVDSFLAEYD